MNVHFSYKISKTSDLEKQVHQQLEKLKKYLQVFRPELVHVKGIVEESSAREGVIVTLNLRLPSGQMAAQEKSPVASSAVRAAFDALTEQLKRHKQVLRSKHKWARHRDADRRVHDRNGKEIGGDIAFDLLRNVDGLPLTAESRQYLHEAAQEGVS